MIKIGLITPWDGPAGIWAPSAEASAQLAVAEINNAEGLFGQELKLVIADAGTDAAGAVRAVSDAVDLSGADAIVALVPSYARAAISTCLGGRIPYIYTPQFEGNERDRDIVTIGETSEELLRPGIEWLMTHKSANRYYIVGSSYVWPRESSRAAMQIIKSKGGIVVAAMEVPFGGDDYSQLFDDIRRKKPDVVVSFLLGYEAISFNRAFAEAGFARSILRFSSAIDETIIYNIGEQCTENMFVTSGYFSSLRSRHNDGYLERYYGAFGDSAPPPNGFGESCYEGVYCLAALSLSAGALNGSEVSKKVGRTLQTRTARGAEAQAVAGAPHQIHFAEVEGCEFRIRSQG